MHKIKLYYQTATNNITSKIQRDAEIQYFTLACR